MAFFWNPDTPLGLAFFRTSKTEYGTLLLPIGFSYRFHVNVPGCDFGGCTSALYMGCLGKGIFFGGGDLNS